MPDTAEHILIDRMREVVTDCDAFLNEPEQKHLLHCAECLTLFSQLVMSNEE